MDKDLQKISIDMSNDFDKVLRKYQNIAPTRILFMHIIVLLLSLTDAAGIPIDNMIKILKETYADFKKRDGNGK